MKKLFSSKLVINLLVFGIFALIAGFAMTHSVFAQTQIPPDQLPYCQQIDAGQLGFRIPSLADILTFVIRIFFVVAGLAALIFMLLGAFAWITSGGDKEAIGAARDKIQAAAIGLIMIVVVLAIMWTIETVVFKRRICVGISCPVTIPGLITTTGDVEQCQCLDSATGEPLDPPVVFGRNNVKVCP